MCSVINCYFSAVVYRTVEYCTVPHCSVLYCSLLYCAVLYCLLVKFCPCPHLTINTNYYHVMSHRRAAGTPHNVLDAGWEGGANFVSQLIKLKNYLNICIEDSKNSILSRSVPVGKFSSSSIFSETPAAPVKYKFIYLFTQSRECV